MRLSYLMDLEYWDPGRKTKHKIPRTRKRPQ